MVAPLPAPIRPLTGGEVSNWEREQARFRIYHHDGYSPTGLTPRQFGPLHRFDHHVADASGKPGHNPDRSVLYFADELGTSGAEVFGDEREANICSRYRAVAAVPSDPAALQILFGAPVMSLGATMELGTGEIARPLSQEWARAIYEDHPSGIEVSGVRYLGAHDGGFAAAVWERAPLLEIAVQSDGAVADFPLFGFADIWRIFANQMRARRIIVTKISDDDCRLCMDNPPAT